MKQTIFILMAMLVALTASAQNVFVFPATDSTFYIFETDFQPTEYDSMQLEQRLVEIKQNAEAVIGTYYQRLYTTRQRIADAEQQAQDVLGLDSLAIQVIPDSTFDGWYTMRINGTVYDEVRVRDGRIQSQELPEVIRLRAVNSQSFYLRSATLIEKKTYMVRTDNFRVRYRSSEGERAVVMQKLRDL